MGQKIHPVSIRLGLHENWRARWLAKRGDVALLLEEDEAIRSLIARRFKDAGVASVEIERGVGVVTVLIKTSRPGLVIGRGGNGIEALRMALAKTILELRKKRQRGAASGSGLNLRIEVEEVRKPDTVAAIVAEGIVRDLERRVRPRRALKQALLKVTQNPEVKGVKILAAGRLGGAEISRSEWLKKGELPLSTLRAQIDYAAKTAFTTYGTIGVKVWIYKGEKFE